MLQHKKRRFFVRLKIRRIFGPIIPNRGPIRVLVGAQIWVHKVQIWALAFDKNRLEWADFWVKIYLKKYKALFEAFGRSILPKIAHDFKIASKIDKKQPIF